MKHAHRQREVKIVLRQVHRRRVTHEKLSAAAEASACVRNVFTTNVNARVGNVPEVVKEFTGAATQIKHARVGPGAQVVTYEDRLGAFASNCPRPEIVNRRVGENTP
jgi:hypothetical protein